MGVMGRAFPCEQCGCCCIHVDLILDIEHLDRGDGVCIHLTKDNLCRIYGSRPDACNVETQYETKWASIMTREEYHKLSKDSCKALRAQRYGVEAYNT